MKKNIKEKMVTGKDGPSSGALIPGIMQLKPEELQSRLTWIDSEIAMLVSGRGISKRIQTLSLQRTQILSAQLIIRIMADGRNPLP